MEIITSLGRSSEDAARIRKDIQNIARSSKTLDEAIHKLSEQYDAESLIAGFMFYAMAFTPQIEGRTVFMAPNMN